MDFDFIKMPAPVAGWRLPEVTVEDPATIAQAKELLDALADSIRAYKVGGPSQALSCTHLDARNAEVVTQVLGEGEVSILMEGAGVTIQESVMPGVWRVVTPDSDYIEVADVPALVRARIRAQERTRPAMPESLPEGAMNVLPVLAEIADAAQSWVPGKAALEISLTLLPMTPVDLQVLNEALGIGTVTVLSRGYGNCRIQALGVRNVWRTAYFNLDDAMILDVVTVGDVPAAAVAAQEDIDEAHDRLKRIMEAYF